MLTYIFLLLAVPAWVYGQDVDIYQRTQNDRFDFPQRPAGMTFDEYELLSTELRLQDMAAAMVVPGYVHFLIKEKKTGWILVGTRAAGYAGAAYLALNDQSLWRLLFDPVNRYTDAEYTLHATVAYLSAALIAGSYLYDWIHGRYLLQHKQTQIRFKYSPVIGSTSHQGQAYLTGGISIRF